MQTYYFEDIAVGMSAQLSKLISMDDVLAFADISGDTNPLHLCPDYAATTPFRERIAHGSLTASLISAVIGTKLPGTGAIYVSQTLNFRAPVAPGQLVTATATISQTRERQKNGLITLHCDCQVKNKSVLDGEAVVMLAKRRPDQHVHDEIKSA